MSRVGFFETTYDDAQDSFDCDGLGEEKQNDEQRPDDASDGSEWPGDEFEDGRDLVAGRKRVQERLYTRRLVLVRCIIVSSWRGAAARVLTSPPATILLCHDGWPS